MRVQSLAAIRAVSSFFLLLQAGIELANNPTAVTPCHSPTQNLGTRYTKSRAFRDRDAEIAEFGARIAVIYPPTSSPALSWRGRPHRQHLATKATKPMARRVVPGRPYRFEQSSLAIDGGGGGNRTRVPKRSNPHIYAHSQSIELFAFLRLRLAGSKSSAIPEDSYPGTLRTVPGQPAVRRLPRSTGEIKVDGCRLIKQQVRSYRLHLRFILRFFTRPPEPSERHTGSTSIRSKPDRPH